MPYRPRIYFFISSQTKQHARPAGSPLTPSAPPPPPPPPPPPTIAPPQHMEPARQGREKCRYDDDTRLVAGCLPVTADGRLVLIGSVKRSDWLLPKGGWDTDETAAEAAVREAYEEAGVKGVVTADLGSHEIVSSRGNKSRAAMFALLVTEVLDTWPEKHRRRKVVSLEEAFACCIRPEVVSVLRAYEDLL
ncbi:unnamed protein product [Pylaiella littoralis]